MTDKGWLASFGGRSRASTSTTTTRAPTPALELNEQKNDPTMEPNRPLSNHAQWQAPHKSHKIVRISSYMGLGSAASTRSGTPSILDEQPEPPPSEPAPSKRSMSSGELDGYREDFYRATDRTWHNPNLLQMIEKVSCTMMANGSTGYIPRHLNGFVATIIEEYAHQTSELEGLRTKVAMLDQTRDNELKEFASMTEEWQTRESGFKAEINRLEHIIADTSNNGVQSVLLARAGSVVNRNDGKQFRAKLNRLSRADDEETINEPENSGKPHNAIPERPELSRGGSSYKTIDAVPRILDHKNDVYLSDNLRPSQRQYNPDHELDGKMAAARLSFNLTRQPPAGNALSTAVESKTSRDNSKGSTNSSSSSSNTSASSSVSLITQGLLARKLETERTTEANSPKENDPQVQNGQTNAKAVLDLAALQEMANRLGLPEDAIDDDGSFVLTRCEPRITNKHQQRFSFDYGDEGLRGESSTDPKQGLPKAIGGRLGAVEPAHCGAPVQRSTGENVDEETAEARASLFSSEALFTTEHPAHFDGAGRHLLSTPPPCVSKASCDTREDGTDPIKCVNNFRAKAAISGNESNDTRSSLEVIVAEDLSSRKPQCHIFDNGINLGKVTATQEVPRKDDNVAGPLSTTTSSAGLASFSSPGQGQGQGQTSSSSSPSTPSCASTDRRSSVNLTDAELAAAKALTKMTTQQQQKVSDDRNGANNGKHTRGAASKHDGNEGASSYRWRMLGRRF